MNIEKFSFQLRTNKPNRVLSIFDVKSINNFLKGDFDTVYVNSMNSGAVAGNHYHKEKQEVFACIYGELKIYFENIITKEKKVYLLKAGEPTLLRVESGVAHAVENISKETSHLIVFSIGKPKDEDAFEYKII